jgi:hypothetical protein
MPGVSSQNEKDLNCKCNHNVTVEYDELEDYKNQVNEINRLMGESNDIHLGESRKVR